MNTENTALKYEILKLLVDGEYHSIAEFIGGKDTKQAEEILAALDEMNRCDLVDGEYAMTCGVCLQPTTYDGVPYNDGSDSPPFPWFAAQWFRDAVLKLYGKPRDIFEKLEAQEQALEHERLMGPLPPVEAVEK